MKVMTYVENHIAMSCPLYDATEPALLWSRKYPSEELIEDIEISIVRCVNFPRMILWE